LANKQLDVLRSNLYSGEKGHVVDHDRHRNSVADSPEMIQNIFLRRTE